MHHHLPNIIWKSTPDFSSGYKMACPLRREHIGQPVPLAALLRATCVGRMNLRHLRPHHFEPKDPRDEGIRLLEPGIRSSGYGRKKHLFGLYQVLRGVLHIFFNDLQCSRASISWALRIFMLLGVWLIVRCRRPYLNKQKRLFVRQIAIVLKILVV